MGAAAFDLLAPLRSASGVDADARKGLPLAEVERIFAAMAVAATTAIRAGLVTELLGRASALEAKYLLKLMLGDMRIGVKESLVEEAMAAAAGVEVAAVRHAVMLEADLAGAVRRAFAGTLGEARMRLFHPLGFMLASPVETPEEAIARFTEKPKKVTAVKKPRGKKAVVRSTLDDLRVDHPADAEDFADVAVLDTIAVAPESEAYAELSAAAAADVVDLPGRAAGMVEAYLEDKYDGMRAQVHGGDPAQPGRVAIYSRNREDITESFPELVEAFARGRGCWCWRDDSGWRDSGVGLCGRGWRAGTAVCGDGAAHRAQAPWTMPCGGRCRWCLWRLICCSARVSCGWSCRCASGGRGWRPLRRGLRA